MAEADADDSHASEVADAVALLGDPTRTAILRALGRRKRERPTSPTISFSTLQERAGIDDRGNFNYHLDRLVGRLVARTESGYRLSPQGLRVFGALVAGVYDLDWTWGPEPVEGTCSWCGEGDLDVARYEDGLLVVETTCGHPSTFAVPPSVLEDREDGTWQERVAAWLHHRFRLVREGLCPLCGGRMDPRVDPDGRRVHYRGACERCGARTDFGVGAAVASAPVVVAFLRERGLDVWRTPPWRLDFCASRAADVLAEDPLRVELDVERAGDVLSLSLDDRAAVCDHAVTTG